MKKLFYFLVALLPNTSVYAQCTVSVVPTTSTFNFMAQLSGNTVVWSGRLGGVSHIFKYDGTTTTQLSTTSTVNTDPQIEGNTVVWWRELSARKNLLTTSGAIPSFGGTYRIGKRSRAGQYFRRDLSFGEY
jgi:hypothetical protein